MDDKKLGLKVSKRYEHPRWQSLVRGWRPLWVHVGTLLGSSNPHVGAWMTSFGNLWCVDDVIWRYLRVKRRLRTLGAWTPRDKPLARDLADPVRVNDYWGAFKETVDDCIIMPFVQCRLRPFRLSGFVSFLSQTNVANWEGWMIEGVNNL